MSLVLSAEQERARTAFLSWFRSPHKARPYFFLTGGAGRGKTHCVKAIIDSVKDNVILATPTGKAALVMSKAAGKPVQTIHSLIYKPAGTGGDRNGFDKIEAELKTLKEGSDRHKQLTREMKKLLSGVKLLFTLNLDSKLKEASLLIVDEVSMCSEEMINDLLSFGVPLLVLGDPYQLPPVMGKSFFKLNEADVCLTEIHRQAKDSPIIYLAELARLGKPLSVGRYGDSVVTREVEIEEAMSADQILVGTNKMRIGTNRRVREILKRESDLPVPGDRVVCRRNDSKFGLLNGDQFIVDKFDQTSKLVGKTEVTTNWIRVSNETLTTTVECHLEYFFGKEPNPWDISKAQAFTWGWVITTHSAQGSGWPYVFVLDESRKFGREVAAKHLYTSITRSSEKVLIKLT